MILCQFHFPYISISHPKIKIENKDKELIKMNIFEHKCRKISTVTLAEPS